MIKKLLIIRKFLRTFSCFGIKIVYSLHFFQCALVLMKLSSKLACV